MYNAARGALAILAVTLGIRSARAQSVDEPTRSAARTLGESGVEAYAAGDYVTASRRLEQSFQLVPVPTLGLWSARALRQLGKLVEAQQRFQAVEQMPLGLGNPSVQRAARADAKREAGELEARIPSLQIRLEGIGVSDAVVSLDEAVLSPGELTRNIPVNPGRHKLVGRHAEEISEVSVTLDEGEHERAILRFAGAAGRADQNTRVLPAEAQGRDTTVSEQLNPWRTAAWLGVGIGAAGVTTGVLAYVIGQSDYDDLPPGCKDGGECPPSDTLDRYNTARTVHVVSLVSGGVLAAAGLTLLLVTGERNGEVALRLGPGAAMLDGTF